MPLFTFPDIEKISREAALEQFKDQLPSGEVIVIGEEQRLSKKINTEEPFVILGHTREIENTDWFDRVDRFQTVGGYPVKDLVQQFDNFRPSIPKSKVKDIYLVSCEAGYGNPCYAQQLAEEFGKKGYTNIRIHAITNPLVPNHRYTGMRVEMITHAGIAALHGGPQFGHAGAFMTTPRYDQLTHELKELQKQKADLLNPEAKSSKKTAVSTRAGSSSEKGNGYDREKLHKHLALARVDGQIFRKIRELKEEKQKHYIMSTSTLCAEMNRAENTFTASINSNHKLTPSKKSPLIDISRKPQVSTSSSTPTVDRFNDIKADLFELKSRCGKKLCSNIDKLLLAMNDKKGWKQAIFNIMDKYHLIRKINLIKNKDNSTFYNLLVHLVKEYDLTRDDDLRKHYADITAQLNEHKLSFDTIILNPGRNKTHVTVLRGEEVSEFKFNPSKAGSLAKEVNNYLSQVQKKDKKQDKRKKASSSSEGDEETIQDKNQVSRSKKSNREMTKIINKFNTSLEAGGFILDETTSISKLHGKFELRGKLQTGQQLICTLNETNITSQIGYLVNALEILREQERTFSTFSFKPGQKSGFEIQLDENPEIILRKRHFDSDLKKAFLLVSVDSTDSSSSETDVSSVDNSGSPPTTPETPGRDETVPELNDSDQSEEGVTETLLGEMKTFQHEYQYGADEASTRGYHIWSEARLLSCKRGESYLYLPREKQGLRGDVLKRAILEAFKRILETNPVSEHPRLVSEFRDSPEMRILKKSQGFCSTVLFFKTDSLVAFNNMVADIPDYKAPSVDSND
jgi:hypothetical protein